MHEVIATGSVLFVASHGKLDVPAPQLFVPMGDDRPELVGCDPWPAVMVGDGELILAG